MAQGPGNRTDVERKPEAIREDMEQTRSALTEKLETLEKQVMGRVEAVQSTVQTVKDTVQGTVEMVKETVQDTVTTVRRSFDLRYQVQQRPWLMLGASVVAGFALGSLLGPTRRVGRPAEARAEQPIAQVGVAVAPRPGLWRRLQTQFGDELQALQGMAIGAFMGLVRDWLKEAFPDLAPQLERVLDSATTKLGGEPVHGPILGPNGRHPSHPTYPEY